MKLKLTVILTTLVVTMGLLLGASTAQETEVIFEGNNATGIKNLEVDTVLYNVKFLFDSAENIYGDPLIFDFPREAKALEASSAVRAALNSVEAVTTVGPWEDTEFLIGFDEEGDFVGVTHDVYADPDGPWQTAEWGTSLRWPSNFYTYADFTQEVFETEVVPIPRTGQTQSYYAGDDGDLQKGAPWPVPRFTDNADGTVTDHLTELIWNKYGKCVTLVEWESAMEEANQMAAGTCGLSDDSQPGDWRLPNRRELDSLIDISRRLPALPAGHPFSQVLGVYWTSSSAATEQWGEVAAWAVDMTTGEAKIQGKDAGGGYLMVRDAIED